MSRPELVLWEPHPAHRAASLFARRKLREASAAWMQQHDGSGAAELGRLLSALYAIKDREWCVHEVEGLRQQAADADGLRRSVEAWGIKNGSIARSEGRLGLIHPYPALLTEWLSLHVKSFKQLANQYTRDPVTLLELAHAVEIARSTARRAREDPGRLPQPIMIMGETGTGKELLARALNAIYVKEVGRVERSDMGAVNCGGLPPNLIESELFGHRKGSFTGAVAEHIGILEANKSGVVLLDEIGDAPGEVQLRLLRFLNNGEIRMIGSTEAKCVHPWVICAGQPKIDKDRREGRFREDLWHRISGQVIVLSPLRKRGDDALYVLEKLVAVYVGKAPENWTPKLSPSSIEAVRKYPWTGNLRELDALARELADYILAIGFKAVIGVTDLPHRVADRYLAAADPIERVAYEFIDLRGDAPADTPDVPASELVGALKTIYVPRSNIGYLRILDLVREVMASDVVTRVVGAERREKLKVSLNQMERVLEARLLKRIEHALTVAEQGAADAAPDGEPPSRDFDFAFAPDDPQWLQAFLTLVARADGEPELLEIIAYLQRRWLQIPGPVRALLQRGLDVLTRELVSADGTSGPQVVPAVINTRGLEASSPRPVTIERLRTEQGLLFGELQRHDFRGVQLAKSLRVRPLEIWRLVKGDPHVLSAALEAHGNHGRMGRAMGVDRGTVGKALKSTREAARTQH